MATTNDGWPKFIKTFDEWRGRRAREAVVARGWPPTGWTPARARAATEMATAGSPRLGQPVSCLAATSGLWFPSVTHPASGLGGKLQPSRLVDDHSRGQHAEPGDDPRTPGMGTGHMTAGALSQPLPPGSRSSLHPRVTTYCN